MHGKEKKQGSHPGVTDVGQRSGQKMASLLGKNIDKNGRQEHQKKEGKYKRVIRPRHGQRTRQLPVKVVVKQSVERKKNGEKKDKRD
jgi:hypothetical protein